RHGDHRCAVLRSNDRPRRAVLHPFPARRSSDLWRAVLQLGGRARVELAQAREQLVYFLLRQPSAAGTDAWLGGRLAGHGLGGRLRRAGALAYHLAHGLCPAARARARASAAAAAGGRAGPAAAPGASGVAATARRRASRSAAIRASRAARARWRSRASQAARRRCWADSSGASSASAGEAA